MKFIWTAVLLLLTACTGGTETARIAGEADAFGRVILLIEDNYAGTGFSAHINRHPVDSYEAEAYILPRDNIDSSRLYPNQRVQVTKDTGQGIMLERDRHLAHDDRFLPVIHTEAEALPYTESDLLHYFRPVESHHWLFITADTLPAGLLAEMFDFLPDGYRLQTHTPAPEMASFLDSAYYLLDSEGTLIESSSPEKILQALEEGV
ncbi:hypothetical protein [Alkalicoccus urumqiensis]|uniref:Uncharacterized protein n=1 Tax=Alkalicoccus urumqiensis TaxID=1548213 RepID=A0A2P6MGU0_ALKUR|nr:hypothetical protein [Alkalicoccus urumqiensis]PRO65492.1 hypothetical protein C6I21_10085 [Alkalicoccus urumqiensis]